MASLDVDGEAVVMRLSLLERLGAFAAVDPRAPVAEVEIVRVSDQPWSELRGIRAPGTGWPGLIALGTRRFSGGRDFVAVYRRSREAVVVEFAAGPFGRFVVSHDQPGELATQLRERIRAVAAREGAEQEAGTAQPGLR